MAQIEAPRSSARVSTLLQLVLATALVQGCGGGATDGADATAGLTVTESVDGARIAPLTKIVDHADNAWTLSSGVVYKNGAKAAFTDGVGQLLYLGGEIYQNVGTSWWSWNGTGWTSTPDPRVTSAPDSSVQSGSTDVGKLPALIDGNKNVWVVSGGVVYENGATAGTTANITELLFHDGRVYAETSSSAWSIWSGVWTTTADPLGSTPPAPAAAVGYTVQTFNSTKLGSAAGEWLPFSFFGNKEPAGAYAQNDDGSISITGHSGNSYNADLATAAQDSSAADRWSGMAFGGGAYFEAEFSFTGTPKGYTVRGWPAFWADDVESLSGAYASTIQWPGQAAGFNGTAEVDFVEALVDSADAYSAGTHAWYGKSGSGDDTSQGVGPVSIGAAKFSALNRYGCLWVPASDTKQGYIEFFFNRVQVGKAIVWNKYDPATPPPPVAGESAMALLDTRHLVPILGVANPELPMTITSVSVWQASTANNLVH